MKAQGSDWDTVVVGAGPAGSTCALELARRGVKVLLADKASWPRYKTCGGGLIGRARNSFDLSLDGIIEQATNRAELQLADLDSTFEVVRDRPIVTMTMRSDLDALLVEHAAQAGAVFRDSSMLTELERRRGGWTLQLGRDRLTTRYVIAADGAASATARLAGWPEHQRPVPAIESEVEVDEATLSRFEDLARFDLGSIPAGYAWIFPKARHLSIGCLTFQRNPRSLRKQLDRYLESMRIRPLAREDHGFIIPVRPRAKDLARDGVLLTGDAAGLADPVTCEGISNAISSGRLAARAVGDAHREEPVTVYQRSLQASILGELRHARLLAHLLYRRPRVRRFVFRRIGQPLSEAMVSVISGEATYRDLLLDPRRSMRALRSLLRPGKRH